jgi:hypothetical protein
MSGLPRPLRLKPVLLKRYKIRDEDNKEINWAKFHYEGERFETRAVSRSEYEALKRFGEYEELGDETLRRMEGDKEYRVFCEDVGTDFPFGLITPGYCSMLEEAYDRIRQEQLEKKAQGNGEGKQEG